LTVPPGDQEAPDSNDASEGRGYQNVTVEQIVPEVAKVVVAVTAAIAGTYFAARLGMRSAFRKEQQRIILQSDTNHVNLEEHLSWAKTREPQIVADIAVVRSLAERNGENINRLGENVDRLVEAMDRTNRAAGETHGRLEALAGQVGLLVSKMIGAGG